LKLTPQKRTFDASKMLAAKMYSNSRGEGHKGDRRKYLEFIACKIDFGQRGGEHSLQVRLKQAADISIQFSKQFAFAIFSLCSIQSKAFPYKR